MFEFKLECGKVNEKNVVCNFSYTMATPMLIQR